MLGDFAFQELGRQEGRLCDMSRSIWENPEGPYREYHASRLCADFLEENGFAVEMDVAITFWRYPWQAVPWQQKRKWKSRE